MRILLVGAFAENRCFVKSKTPGAQTRGVREEHAGGFSCREASAVVGKTSIVSRFVRLQLVADEDRSHASSHANFVVPPFRIRFPQLVERCGALFAGFPVAFGFRLLRESLRLSRIARVVVLHVFRGSILLDLHQGGGRQGFEGNDHHDDDRGNEEAEGADNGRCASGAITEHGGLGSGVAERECCRLFKNRRTTILTEMMVIHKF